MKDEISHLWQTTANGSIDAIKALIELGANNVNAINAGPSHQCCRLHASAVGCENGTY